MKKLVFCILLSMPVFVCAQRIKQKGWVTELNSNKAALAGVQIEYDEAPSTSSDDGGAFVLTFRRKKYGDLIFMSMISKLGYEVVNEKELLCPTLSKDKIKIVLCKKGLVDKMRAEYYNISKEALNRGYREQMKRLKYSLTNKKIKEKDYFFKIKQLQEQLKKSEDRASELAEKYARTNFDDVSDEYRQAFEQFKLGNLNATVEILERVNLPERLKNRLEEKQRIKNLTDQFKSQIADNELGIKQDMQAIRLAADMYNLKMDFGKADDMYSNLVALDSTNIDNIMIYGEFSYSNKQYYKAKKLFLSALNISRKQNDLLQESNSLSNLAIVYNALNDVEKAITCVEESTTIKKQFPRNNVMELKFVKDYRTLGNSFFKKGNSFKAREEYGKALKILSGMEGVENAKLKIAINNELATISEKEGFVDPAFDYYNEILKIIHDQKLGESEEGKSFLGITYNNIGGLYFYLTYYDSAEKYYKKSLVHIEKLAEINPVAFSPVLAELKYNLGNVYFAQHRLKEAERLFREAIKVNKELVSGIPEAYLPQLSNAYQKLANVLRENKNYDEALSYSIKSIDINAKLYDWAPDLFLENVYENQYNLGVIFIYIKEYEKADEMLNIAYGIADKLSDKSFFMYGTKPSLVESRLGLMYKEKGELDKAIKEFCELVMTFRYIVNRRPAKYMKDLSFVLSNLGVLYIEKSRFKEALTLNKEALGYYKHMEKLNSKSFKIEKYITYGIMAKIYLKKFRDSQKEEDLNKSKELVDIAIKGLSDCEEKYSVGNQLKLLEDLGKKIDKKIEVNKNIKYLEKIYEESKKSKDSLNNSTALEKPIINH